MQQRQLRRLQRHPQRRAGELLLRARRRGSGRNARPPSKASPAANTLHPLQRSFLEDAALQCGICTPGFIVAAKALLEAEPDADEARIRHWLAGNLCRCTGYDKIVHAVLDAAQAMRATPAKA